MHSDLQSVEKQLSARSNDLLPRKYWKLKIGPSRFTTCRISLQDLSGGVSRFSRQPDTGNCRPHFFDPTGSNTIQTPDRIEKNVFFSSDPRPQPYSPHLDRKSADGDFLQPGPSKSGKHSEARKTNFQRFRGESSHERAERDFFS